MPGRERLLASLVELSGRSSGRTRAGVLDTTLSLALLLTEADGAVLVLGGARAFERSVLRASQPRAFADLAASGFTRLEGRSFLLGATRLWVAETGSGVGQKATARSASVQGATTSSRVLTHHDPVDDAQRAERVTWRLLQAITSTGLAAALAWALVVWVKVRDDLPLSPPQRLAGWVLIVAGLAFFSVRGVVQWLRWSAVREGGGGAG